MEKAYYCKYSKPSSYSTPWPLADGWEDGPSSEVFILDMPEEHHLEASFGQQDYQQTAVVTSHNLTEVEESTMGKEESAGSCGEVPAAVLDVTRKGGVGGSTARSRGEVSVVVSNVLRKGGAGSCAVGRRRAVSASTPDVPRGGVGSVSSATCEMLSTWKKKKREGHDMKENHPNPCNI
ncbi:unnamed protein product [Prunus armeniaca]